VDPDSIPSFQGQRWYDASGVLPMEMGEEMQNMAPGMIDLEALLTEEEEWPGRSV